MDNKDQIYNSATEFYLYNPAYDVSDLPWEIYEKWRKQTGYVVSDPQVAAFIIQTFEAWKSCSKEEIETVYRTKF